jgi:hypothetical protein
MRTRRVESSRLFSVYLPTSLYQKLLSKAGRGKINTFIRGMLEEKLIKEEQQKKEQLKQQLIKGYQAQAKNKKLQQELRTMEKAQFEDLENE